MNLPSLYEQWNTVLYIVVLSNCFAGYALATGLNEFINKHPVLFKDTNLISDEQVNNLKICDFHDDGDLQCGL